MENEVIWPNVINVLWPGTNKRTVFESEPASLWLFHGNPLDPLVIQLPSCTAQQGCDTAITVTPILPGQFEHVLDQTILIVT